jgi:hypothetical protein
MTPPAISGFVYAIGASDGTVKLGWSADPMRRLAKMKSDCPSHLRLLGLIAATLDQEGELHSLFVPWRVRGEWYRLEGPVLAFVEMLPLPKPRIAARTARAIEPGASALRIWRAQNDVTLADLSVRAGLQVPTLSQIERGERSLSIAALRRVMAITGLTIEELSPKWAAAARDLREAAQ